MFVIPQLVIVAITVYYSLSTPPGIKTSDYVK